MYIVVGATLLIAECKCSPHISGYYVLELVLGLDNRNVDNCYRYSTFSDNRYCDQISICTYAHAHSVQGICF